MFDDLLMPPTDDVLAVTDLTRRIKRMLEGAFERVWVRGEVSNLRRQSSGHVYFSLKDDRSQMPCVLFARDAARQSFQLEDGMELMLFGDLSVYEPHGRYQLITRIAIQSGEGRLQLEFERLKRKLAAEGLFDAGNKRALPRLPKRIALVTSPSAAALRDFLRILRRRRFGGEVVLFPARVQGREAPGELRDMLARAGAGFDLIVLTRGGGSIEDLWGFNDEALARAVANAPIPVISAVGHEIDHVLTDYAADRRAETPSGAAELISSLYLDARQTVVDARAALEAAMESALAERDQAHERLAGRLRVIAPQRQVEMLGMRLDELEHRLGQTILERLRYFERQTGEFARRLSGHHPRSRIALMDQTLRHHSGRLERATAQSLERFRRDLAHFGQRLENSSVQSALRRGYSILEDGNGAILDRVSQVAEAREVRARMRDGIAELRGSCDGRD